MKKIQLFDYNPQWAVQFEKEATLIKETLGDECVAIHHIGSTSVPGLKAKKNLDIVCIVDALSSSLSLQEVGYTFKGEFNIPLRYFFSKNTSDSKVNLHAVERDHGFIALNLAFRDYLRTHPEAVERYARLKETLLQDPQAHEKGEGRFPFYTLRKNEYIKETLEKAEFNQVSVVFCLHEDEWRRARELRQKYFFDKVPIEDPYQWTFDHPNHAHIVLYQGSQIGAYAHLHLWPEHRAAMRIIVVEEPFRRQGLGRSLLEVCEKWLKLREYQSLHVESSPTAYEFYKSCGYQEMPFEDPDGYEQDPQDIPMGKKFD